MSRVVWKPRLIGVNDPTECVVIDTVNHSGSQSGETTYCFHSLRGDVDCCICKLTLMTATPQVVEHDENCVSPKTWTDIPQQGSYMPEFWAVGKAGNI